MAFVSPQTRTGRGSKSFNKLLQSLQPARRWASGSWRSQSWSPGARSQLKWQEVTRATGGEEPGEGRAGGLMSTATGQVSLGERGLEPRPVGKGSDHEDVGAEGPLSPGNSQRKGPDGAGAGCPRANGLCRRRVDV